MWFLLIALLAQSADFEAEGLKALDSQKYDAAVELFSKAVAAEPKDYSAHFHLALAYNLLGKDGLAIPEYRSALELKPQLYEAELNLGISLVGVKDAGAAIAPLRDAVRQKPAEFRPVFYLGEALLDQKQFVPAAEPYTTALSLVSKSPPP